MMISCFFHLWS